MNKKIKISLLSGIAFAMMVPAGCIPIAFRGLPTLISSVTPASERTDLCNLLLSAGGTDADVQKCLTATQISQDEINRLCALTVNLSNAQKETLRTSLSSQGVDVAASCPILANAVATPSPTTTPFPTSVPVSSTPVPVITSAPTTQPTAAPTAAPTASNQPLPSPTSSTGTGGGNTGGGIGGGTGGGGTDSGLEGQIGNN